MGVVHLFLAHAAQNATNVNIGNLDNWNLSSVEDASCMFHMFGYSATNWNIGNLSGWDTSNIKNMERMFYYAGYSAAHTLDLTNWDVSNVVNHNEFSIIPRF